jgi:formylglycine-generating enzyme required for sulfatase activity
MDKLLFAEFVGYLGRQGFTVGVDQYVRLHALLRRLGPDCRPEQVKVLLCPLFATNAKQQAQFYRAFDAYFAAFDPQRAEEQARQAAEPEPATEPETAPQPLWARKWPYVLAGIVLLALLGLGIQHALQWQERPKPPEAVEEPAAAPTPAPVEREIKQEIVPLAPQTEPPAVEPATRLAALWREYGASLRWVLILAPAVIWLLAEGYRLNRRALVLQRQRRKTPPYLLHLQVEPPDPAFLKDERFYTAARGLRRRLRSAATVLDPAGTVRQTIRAGGFPTPAYRPRTRPPEYLVLIERPLGRDHYTQFCDTLVNALRDEGLFVARYFYDHNPRVCFQSPDGQREYLHELKDRFSEHRLLLIGTGDELLDPVTGRLDAWTEVLHAWRERALLTTVAPAEWGRRERALREAFVLLPAALDGLAALGEYFATPPDINVRSHSASRLQPASDDAPDAASVNADPGTSISELRKYLGDDVFQWLCACAVYPELHWNLTLSLAALPCLPDGLLTEANVLRLIRLPWFRTGALPDELRLALLAELTPEQLRGIRTALFELLERQEPPPAASGAYDVYRLHLAVLGGRRRLKRARRLLREPAGAGARRVIRDYTFVRFLEAGRGSPLNLVLPRRLRRVFFRQGLPWFGLKTGARAALVVLLTAALVWLTPTPPPTPSAAESDFVMREFQAADLPSTHPEARAQDGAKVVPASDASGFLCYGARLTLPAIDALHAHFRLALDETPAGDRRAAVLEVYDVDKQTIVQQQVVTSSMFAARGVVTDFKLSFGLEQRTQLELRVFSEGGAALRAETLVLANPAKTMEFVWIESGCFQMGSPDSEAGRNDDEGPVHEVCVDGFYMGKYEVTNAQYRQWKREHDSTDYKGHSLNADEQPAVLVSWEDAREFADWLTDQSGGQAAFRLPTEAEWEYAARAGTTTARFWGDDPDKACAYANVHDDTSDQAFDWAWSPHDCDDGYAVSAPVGSFRPNAFGLYDMLGNVWEWCADSYVASYAGAPADGSARGNLDDEKAKILRGGSWVDSADNCRAACRPASEPGSRSSNGGFRVVLSASARTLK